MSMYLYVYVLVYVCLSLCIRLFLLVDTFRGVYIGNMGSLFHIGFHAWTISGGFGILVAQDYVGSTPTSYSFPRSCQTSEFAGDKIGVQ